ncbi:MAG: glycosyltransferase family 39 protein [Candidatus Nanoarchaeia archaeon]|nr:glycosyltransferase family 39 protein [Candidatus Nanoarchaeia archaeon]
MESLEKENPEINDKLEKRKERIIKWFKDKNNIVFILILLLSLVVIFYYFNITKHQTLWYDEAEYMSTANYWAFGIPYQIHQERPPLFPFLAFLLLKLGFNEVGIRILLELVPFFLCLIFFYFLVSKMYSKKIALIATFILSVSWIHIFYTMRLMTDSIGFLFGILSIYCFWEGYINNKGKIYIWLIGFFVSLSFLVRLTGVLYGVLILLFLLVTDKFRFLKNKNMWISLLISLLTILPYLIWSHYYYGNAFAFRAGYGGGAGSALGWWMLTLLYDYPELVFFIFFLVGVLTLLPMFLSLDIILTKENKKYLSDIFILLNILFTLAFFIYFLRQGENRWLMMMSIGIFVISAKGIVLAYDFINKHIGKILAVIALLLILFSGAYYQLNHADQIIKGKINTYDQVREAALWMKQNSDPKDIIVSASEPQNTYYSERKTLTHYNSSGHVYFTPEQFDGIIKELKPKYYVTSVFEPSIPQWTYSYPDERKFIPVQAWFSDPDKKQPILVIYEIPSDFILNQSSIKNKSSNN